MKRWLPLLLLVAPGLSAQSFNGMSEAIARGDYGNLNAVVVSRHGEIIYEEYFRGSSVDDLHQVQSVTKSVGSALVGIAHRKGLLRMDQDLGEIFSGLYDMSSGGLADKSAITVEQVINHRLGIEWDETSSDYRDPGNPVNQMINSGDWYRFVLQRPLAEPPGTDFRYNSGASVLMSRMIRYATGMDPAAFARQELFDPLGFGPVHWELYSEQGPGTGLTDWPNPDGDAPLGFGLWLRARDMVRFGELYLNGGVQDGRRILDADWVETSWQNHSYEGNSTHVSLPGWGYGYQWWRLRADDPSGRSWHVFFASGWGSQVIFLVPELGLVVVTAGDNQDYNGPDVDALLLTRILPELSPRLDSRFDGAWYDTDTDGQGFSMEVRDRQGDVVSFWYTYTMAGEPRWFLLQGKVINGAGEVTIYETEGGVFLQDDPVSLLPWGTARFLPVECNRMELEIFSDEVTTTLPLTRLSGECYRPPD
jgi:CubicO group peptidase (beta-lactamase class C family)